VRCGNGRRSLGPVEDPTRAVVGVGDRRVLPVYPRTTLRPLVGRPGIGWPGGR